MTLSKLMQGKTPSLTYEGWITNDDFVLAVDIGSTPSASKDDYVVVQMGVAGLDAQLNPVTKDKQYIRSGNSSTKTGTQRTFKVTGDRYVGDAFQDFCFSHNIKYGVGNTVVKPYIYFNILNGKGEEGYVSIIINSDGSGNSGDNSGVDIELKKSGSTPTEYTYSASAALQTLSIASVAGATTGTTKITVTPALTSGNTYVYKTAVAVTLPAYNDALTTGWTTWNGTADITATIGNEIAIAEINSSNACIGAGKITVTSK